MTSRPAPELTERERRALLRMMDRVLDSVAADRRGWTVLSTRDPQCGRTILPDGTDITQDLLNDERDARRLIKKFGG